MFFFCESSEKHDFKHARFVSIMLKKMQEKFVQKYFLEIKVNTDWLSKKLLF